MHPIPHDVRAIIRDYGMVLCRTLRPHLFLPQQYTYD